MKNKAILIVANNADLVQTTIERILRPGDYLPMTVKELQENNFANLDPSHRFILVIGARPRHLDKIGRFVSDFPITINEKYKVPQKITLPPLIVICECRLMELPSGKNYESLFEVMQPVPADVAFTDLPF